MTTEELKIIISAEAQDAIKDLNAVKKGVDDLGNTSGTDKLKTSISGNTQAAAQLNDQLQSLRTMSFTSLIAQVAQLGSQFSNYRDIMKEYKQSLGNRQTILGGIDPATKQAFADARKQASAYHDEMQKGLGLMKEAKKQGDGMFYALEHGAGKALIAIGAVVAVVAALVAAVKTGFSTAQRLTASFYEAQKVGLQHSTYQEWAYVMGQVGVEADKLSDFIKSLSAAQNDLRDGSEGMVKAFEALGLSAEEAANMTQEQLLGETITRLQKMENQVERTGIAYRIFGEDDAAQLTNVLNLSNQEMERMINNFYLLGGSASDSAIKKSRSLSASVSNLKLALQGFANTVGEAIMPALTAIVDALTKAVVAINMFLRAVFGFNIVSKGSKDTIEGATGSVGGYTGALNQATAAAEQLRRTTQGFDELNVVSNPNAGAGAGGDYSGDTGGGSIDIPEIDYEGLTKDLGLEEMAKWFEENAEAIQKWTTVVVAATAAWKTFQGAVFLITGKKIGFFAALGTAIKSLITAFPKLAGWLSAVIALVKEGNSIWAVMGAAFPKLASAISAVGAAFSKIGAAIGGAVKAVAAFVGGLSAGTIAIIIAAVVAVASAVYFLWENWDAVCKKVTEFCETNIAPIFDEFMNSFGQLWEAIKSVGQAFADLGISIWNAIPEGFREWMASAAEAVWGVIKAIGEWFASIDWLKAIGTVVEWLGGIVVGILGGVIAGAIQAILNLVESVVQFITGVVQVIAGLVGGLVNLIVALFTGDFSKALDSVKMIWEGIKNVFKSMADAVIGTVWAFIEGIIDFFVHMWDVLVGHSIVPDMIEAIIDWFFKLPKTIYTLLSNFVKEVINFFKNLASQAGTWASNMWTNIKKPFQATATWFKNIFSQAWTGIKNAWSGVTSFFTGVWDKIKSIFSKVGTSIASGVTGAVKGAINSVLSSVVNKINTFIGWINSAIGLINEIPGVNIGKIGKLSVPQLATGGIVTQSTLANIGERGREAVLPLENNTGWMDALADRIAARNNVPSKIVLMVNERELGWASINGINGITKQTGGLQLVL